MAYLLGYATCKGSKEKGRKCWVTNYQEPQVVPSKIQSTFQVAEVPKILPATEDKKVESTKAMIMGRVEYKNSKDNGRKYWITDHRELQITQNHIEIQVASQIAEASKDLSTTEGKEVESMKAKGIDQVESESSKNKDHKYWVTDHQEPQAIPDHIKIQVAPQVAEAAQGLSTTKDKEVKTMESKSVDHVKYKSGKNKVRKCWVTYAQESQVTSGKIQTTQVAEASKNLPIPTEKKDIGDTKLKVIQTRPGRWEILHTGDIDKPKSSLVLNEIQTTSKSVEASTVAEVSEANQPEDTEVEEHKLEIKQTRSGRWETLHIEYTEKPTSSTAVPSETQVDSKLVEASETPKVENKEAEKFESSNSVFDEAQVDPKVVNAPTTTKIVVSKPTVKQTRSGCWEMVPVGYVDQRQSAKKDLAHKYFPYMGPVKNRKLFAPRSCAVPRWGLSCWDKNGNRVRNGDGTPYKPNPKYTTFDRCWNRLPAELRLIIIEMSLEDRRVTIKPKSSLIRDSDPENPKWAMQKWVPLIQPPAALFVNTEFRAAALKKYKYLFGTPKLTTRYENAEGEPCQKMTPPTEPKIPFCWRSDTLVLELDGPEWFSIAVLQLREEDRAQVARLAVRFDAALYHRVDDSGPATIIDHFDFCRAIADFPSLIQIDLLVPPDPDSNDIYEPRRGSLASWKKDTFEKGKEVRELLNVFRKACADELEGFSCDPRWRVPYTVRTVQLLDDGQPSYEGVEELFLIRKELAIAKVPFEDIDRWERVVMRKEI